MKKWTIAATAMLIAACMALATATPIREVPRAGPFIEPTATPVCQPFTGVTLETHRIHASAVELQVSGLEPGDVPDVLYSTFSSNGGTTGISRSVEGADENGEFSFNLTGLFPVEGQSSATWDIRVVHSRGVECTAITLP